MSERSESKGVSTALNERLLVERNGAQRSAGEADQAATGSVGGMVEADRRMDADATPDVTAVAVPWVAIGLGVALLVLVVVLARVAESHSVLLG